MSHVFGIDDLVVTPTDRLARVTALTPLLPSGVWRAEIAYLDADDSACIKAKLLRLPTPWERQHVYKEQKIIKRKLGDDEIVPPCPTLYHLLLLMYKPGEPPQVKKVPRQPVPIIGREAEIAKLLNERDAKGKPLTQQKVADLMGVCASSLQKRITRMKQSGGFKL